MTWLQQIRAGKVNGNEYAPGEDFQRVFTEDLDGLHQLALLLTGDPEKAEQCFVAGLEDCVKAGAPFKQWAHSWAKRVIIKNAIRAVRPHPGATISSVSASSESRSMMESVRALGDFERLVFMMSVLERYSEQECSALLGCSLQDVRTARIQALKQLASPPDSIGRESDKVSAGSTSEDHSEASLVA
jgi:DNA-directed RNA polymerase specialized sigma24 family protein